MKIAAIKGLIFLCFISVTLNSRAGSNDPIIVSIDNQKITKSEFLRVYNKNNTQSTAETKSFQEYMEMFINYKLKVIEAEHEKYDTASGFVSEFKNYRDQLSKQYFIDNATENKLLKEAYERLTNEVHARCIVLRIKPYAMPSDTLDAYNKALEVRNKLIKGVPWDSVVLKYSIDPNAKKTLGDINYFTVFQMKYPFENAAYTIKKGEYSLPIRIQNSYFILQVLDKRSSSGQVKAEHIMVAFPENANNVEIDSAHNKILRIYQKLKSGGNFEDLAKQFSDDHRTAVKGGDLGWFGTGQMIPEFENAAFALQNNGDISEPIKTSFGWHIIKRVDHIDVPPFESVKDNLKQKIQSDERSKLPQLAIIENVKKEIGFKDHPQKIYLLKSVLDSSIFEGKWDVSKANGFSKEILFTLGKNQITLKDFAKYIAESKKYHQKLPFDYYLYLQYPDFVIDKIKEFQANRLEDIYPEFKYLVQEYHDGILLFNLMDEKVWSQAAKDTVGLEQYYNNHKELYNWGERINAIMVSTPNKELAEVAKKYAGTQNIDKIKTQELIKAACHDSTKSCITVLETAYEKGDNLTLDSIGWNSGISDIVYTGGKYLFFVKKDKLAPSQKKFQEVKGTCIADYQTYLEQKFVSDLRKKYKVEIDNKVLDSIKK